MTRIVLKYGGKLDTTTLKETLTKLTPSDKVRGTANVPICELIDVLGDIVITLPVILMNVGNEDCVIMTVTPSGSTAEGSV